MHTNPRPRSSARHGRRALLLSFCAAVALAATLTWPDPAPGRLEAAPLPAGATSLPLQQAPHPGQRTEPDSLQRVRVGEADRTPRATFEELVEQLVTLGARTAELAQDDEIEAAKATDLQARQRFADLLEWYPDAGERGLAMLAGMLEASTDARDGPRRAVLQLVIAAECSRRHEAATAAADHTRSEPLVQALLEVMLQTASAAQVGGQILADHPYLRATHEPAVLAIVQAAGQQRFPRDVATRLLLTLWDNLQRTGERSSDELNRLSMLLLTDADPSKRTAACRQLIADPRYRSMALAWVREHADRSVAAEVAGLAASDLAPTEALAVLRELAPILPRAPNAYMVLGARDPEALALAYRELLAANTQPGIRTDLIAGVGFASSPHGLEVMELALHNDPSPEVRIQAAFVLTAGGQPGLGERAVSQLLDDPVIARDPNRLGALVLTLQNLEAGGDANAIDRLGQRLRTMPLHEESRQLLEALLARSLPDGEVSAIRRGHAAAPR